MGSKAVRADKSLRLPCSGPGFPACALPIPCSAPRELPRKSLPSKRNPRRRGSRSQKFPAGREFTATGRRRAAGCGASRRLRRRRRCAARRPRVPGSARNTSENGRPGAGSVRRRVGGGRDVARAVGAEREDRVVDGRHIAGRDQHFGQPGIRAVIRFRRADCCAPPSGSFGAADLGRRQRRVQPHQRVEAVLAASPSCRAGAAVRAA